MDCQRKAKRRAMWSGEHALFMILLSGITLQTETMSLCENGSPGAADRPRISPHFTLRIAGFCYLNVTSYIGQTGGNHYSCVFDSSADREWAAPILPMVTVCSERRAFISAFEIWGSACALLYFAMGHEVRD